MKKLLSILLLIATMTSLVACQTQSEEDIAQEETTSDLAIVSLSPSNTEILIALGLEENIIAIDTNMQEEMPNLPAFDIYTPNVEEIIALNPTIIFLDAFGSVYSDSSLQDTFKAAGIKVIETEATNSILEIYDNIFIMASNTGTSQIGDEIIATMESEIEQIKEIANTITDKKTVYVEISTPPYMFTTGSETYINDMIEIVGAENVFGTFAGYTSVNEEDLILNNPDVIISTAGYEEDPVGLILNNANWQTITAVINKEVYYIEEDLINRSGPNVIQAIKEIAKAIYPDEFSGI